MLTDNFRPWGRFDWLSQKLNIREWSVLGCLGTEERFSQAISLIKNEFVINHSLYVDVIDKGKDFLEESRKIKAHHKQKLEGILGVQPNVSLMNLLDSPVILKRVVNKFIEDSNGKVIIDISCFPKRFFFPILKILYNSDKVEELIAAYTVPDGYHEGELAENPLPWSHIPMFHSSATLPLNIEKAIIGVGFLPFGLPSLLKDDYSKAELSLLFPFPPGPPNYQRTWDFVREINKFYPLTDSHQILRIDVKDVSGCYNHLTNITSNGKVPSILAPYGPKTQSLAMALFAIKHDCDVYYTQPEQYHPNYSYGVKMCNGNPEVYLYCLKIDNTKLY